MRTKIFALFFIIATVFMAPSGAQSAGSECKGLEKPACQGNDRCSWVNAYKTSKGSEVSAFCRKKPERKKSSQATAAPKG